jgi:hypothetical protein
MGNGHQWHKCTLRGWGLVPSGIHREVREGWAGCGHPGHWPGVYLQLKGLVFPRAGSIWVA